MTQQWSRREFLSGAAGGVALVAAGDILAACGGSSHKRAPGALRTFTYMMPSTYFINFATELLPAAAGYARSDGVDLHVAEASSSPQAVQQVLAGRADVTRQSGITVAQAVGQAHAPLIAIATIAQDSPFRFISAADRPIRSAAEFKGKTIGLGGPGGPADLALDAVLASAGLGPDAVKRPVVPFDVSAFALVQERRIDAFLGATQTIVELRRQGAKFYSFNAGSAVPVLGQSYVVTKDSVEKRGDDLVAFLRAVRKGIDVLLDDDQLDHAIDLLARYPLPELKDRQVAKGFFQEERKLWLAAGKSNLLRNVPSRWREGVDLITRGHLAPAVNADQLYTNKIWDKAFG